MKPRRNTGRKTGRPEEVKRRLLLVDDESECIGPLCELLKENGFMVSAFTSASDALEALSQQTFDLLLTDLVMPEIDGIALLQDALRIDPSIVGIIMTGKGTVQSAVKAMKLGAFDYLIKPFDFAIMKQVLMRALEIRRLREVEKTYQALFENAVGGVYRITPEGNYITVNDAFARLLGYGSPRETRECLKDIGCHLYVDQTRFGRFVRLLEEHTVVLGFESEIIRKDSTRIWISENAFAVRDAKGTPLYYEGIVEDITEKKKSQEELRKSREQLRHLSAHLQSSIEKERRYIAREIHDELGQVLTALHIDLFWLDNKIPRNLGAVRQKIRSMSALVDSGAVAVHRISSEMRTGILDDLGLTAAIEWQRDEFQKRTGIACKVLVGSEYRDLRQDIATAVYRILQEALTNIARHASATLASIRLSEVNGMILLQVEDNGKGIAPEKISAPTSFGLTGICERAYLLKGHVDIRGIHGEGTVLTVALPLDQEYDTV